MSLRHTLKKSLQQLMGRLETDVKTLPQEPPEFRTKLTRNDLLRLIENRGGTPELDLAGSDLSGLDLGWGAMKREMECWRETHPVSNPPWLNESSGGINLAGAVLARSDLRATNLFDANLQNCVLSKCSLQGADLRHAILIGADLFDAKFEKTLMERGSLGGKLSQERADHTSWLSYVPPRLRQANEIYRELRHNFRSIGRYDDASWAYIKERQMEKAIYAPWRARLYFGDLRVFGKRSLPEYNSLSRWSPYVWWFWLKYLLKWLVNWVAELTCGYGERPLLVGAWALVTVLAFSLLFAWFGGVESKAGSLSWLDYFNYSLGAFTTMNFDQLQPKTPLAQTFTSVEALLGISVLALLMFALGNRISRS